MARFRSRESTTHNDIELLQSLSMYPGTHYRENGNVIYSQNVPVTVDGAFSEDQVRPRIPFQDNYLELVKEHRTFIRASGEVEHNKRLNFIDAEGTEFFLTDMDYYRYYGPTHHNYYDDSIDDDEFITAACAGTNPSRAEFDAAIFLGELRDVPSLLKNAAGTLKKAGANEYLKFEYGWKPLVRDTQKLLHVMDKLDRRMQTLQRLSDNGAVRRRYDPPSGRTRQTIPFTRATGVSPFPVNGIDFWVETDVSIHRWADVIWEATPLEGAPSMDLGMRRRAQQALLGGTVDGSTIWNLMPWSWLLDWNSNMSEYISAHRNTVGAKVRSVTLMKTVTLLSNGYLAPITDSYVGYVDSSFNSTIGRTVTTIKSRRPNQKPSAEIRRDLMPILGSNTKTSILGALSMQRLRRMRTW